MSNEMKLNSKELLIREQIKLGKSFKEISELELCKDAYLKRTISKLGYDWKTMKPKEKAFTLTIEPQKQTEPVEISESKPDKEMTIGVDPGSPEGDQVVTSNGTGYGKNPFHEKPTSVQEVKSDADIDALLERQEQAENQIDPAVMAMALALAEQIKSCPDSLKNNDLLKAAQEAYKPKPEVRVQVEKCSRHPYQNVKPGENCPICLKSSIAYENLANSRNHAPPCPKCGQTEIYRMFENGGVIKVLSKKAGHYSCGSCQISYNVRGEQTEWGENDAKYFA